MINALPLRQTSRRSNLELSTGTHLVSAPTLQSFRRHLKTFLLQQSLCPLNFSGPCSDFGHLGHSKKSLIDWLIEHWLPGKQRGEQFFLLYTLPLFISWLWAKLSKAPKTYFLATPLGDWRPMCASLFASRDVIQSKRQQLSATRARRRWLIYACRGDAALATVNRSASVRFASDESTWHNNAPSACGIG